MEKIKELQLAALDELGKQVANIEADLDRLAKLTNEFDIEAKVFVIGERARRLAGEAFAFHRDFHAENSKLLGTDKLPKDVLGFIFGKGLL